MRRQRQGAQTISSWKFNNKSKQKHETHNNNINECIFHFKPNKVSNDVPTKKKRYYEVKDRSRIMRRSIVILMQAKVEQVSLVVNLI
jgi:hypothetical protein